MTISFVPTDEVTRIKANLAHPIIDADGHLIEIKPLVLQFASEIGGPSVAEQIKNYQGPSRALARGGGWAEYGTAPLDRLTCSLPELLYRRLDEIGLDFAMLFPSWGLILLECPDAEVRQTAARALNTYYAQVFGGFRDRLEPVAVIPTVTPDEACAELRYAVGELGLKAVIMTGVIPRHGRPDEPDDYWLDTLGHGSAYNYDPVWETCLELGVVPAFHGRGNNWGTRTSRTGYIYNHLGHFGTAQEAVCRSLIMGGVPQRFPDLQFLFLEGGVTWASQLFADLLGHFDKRNQHAMEKAVDSYINWHERDELIYEFATGLITPFQGAIAQQMSAQPMQVQDEFQESQIRSPEDIVSIFTKQLNFGCEADDPIVGLAFDRSVLPRHSRLNALLGSDIGHWDVPDIRHVLAEAWELVEDGHLSEEDFQEFSCNNVARMYTTLNPNFFDNTVLEGRLKFDAAT